MNCLPCTLAKNAAHKCERFIYAGPYTSRCGHGCDPGPYFAAPSRVPGEEG